MSGTAEETKPGVMLVHSVGRHRHLALRNSTNVDGDMKEQPLWRDLMRRTRHHPLSFSFFTYRAAWLLTVLS